MPETEKASDLVKTKADAQLHPLFYSHYTLNIKKYTLYQTASASVKLNQDLQ
jgi:hypothetical protein